MATLLYSIEKQFKFFERSNYEFKSIEMLIVNEEEVVLIHNYERLQDFSNRSMIFMFVCLFNCLFY